IKMLQRENPEEIPKAAVFIKPYPNQKILERIDWSRDIAECIGVDIDSYNILTMRNLVQLERKTPAQISELKKHAKLPFAIKGVFTKEDVELVKEVKPEIVVISNHGGRVENRIGSTAMFLKEYGPELKNYCDELWVDGGLRTKKDILTASYFGVSEVMLGRPFVTALCRGGEAEVKKMMEHLRG
ncbi:MAG: alpha-hydroxy-acid oxidizing protein, partial [Treponemataceae bacterium]|nr:alpha-hydroxy-acid oxidizing protein [Treponemataceae bacterium]